MKILLSLLLMISCISVSHAEISKEKRAEIEKMLRLTGLPKLMGQMKTQMISSLKARLSEVPTEFWTKFEQKMDMNELIEKIIPLYDKYYTVEDLKAVNAFYESPAGQKILVTLPRITEESMKIGSEWGEKIGKQAAEEAASEKKK